VYVAGQASGHILLYGFTMNAAFIQLDSSFPLYTTHPLARYVYGLGGTVSIESTFPRGLCHGDFY
jgi:hypothetical protein